MRKYEEKLNELKAEIGAVDSINLISSIKEILTDPEINSVDKSAGLCLIGEILWCISTYLDENDPYGYEHFKKALKYNKNNYDALLGIISIFSIYPYPLNTVVTEQEYIMYTKKLIKDFSLLSENQKKNTIENFAAYLDLRETLIDKYGYSWFKK
jgi:hypothetical protein